MKINLNIKINKLISNLIILFKIRNHNLFKEMKLLKVSYQPIDLNLQMEIKQKTYFLQKIHSVIM